MIDITYLDKNKCLKRQISPFSTEWLNELIVSVKNPLIVTDMKTLLCCMQIIDRDNRHDNVGLAIMLTMGDEETINYAKSFMEDRYKFNLRDKYYNMFGQRIKMEINNNLQKEIYIINSYDNEDFAHYQIV